LVTLLLPQYNCTIFVSATTAPMQSNVLQELGSNEGTKRSMGASGRCGSRTWNLSAIPNGWRVSLLLLSLQTAHSHSLSLNTHTHTHTHTHTLSLSLSHPAKLAHLGLCINVLSAIAVVAVDIASAVVLVVAARVCSQTARCAHTSLQL
jgi:hypothetical protein